MDCCNARELFAFHLETLRDRSGAEIRDISISRRVGTEWTAPRRVHVDNWEIPACPVNGPRADAIGNTLGVAWFTAANNFPEVKVIFSTDGGRSFSIDKPYN